MSSSFEEVFNTIVTSSNTQTETDISIPVLSHRDLRANIAAFAGAVAGWAYHEDGTRAGQFVGHSLARGFEIIAVKPTGKDILHAGPGVSEEAKRTHIANIAQLLQLNSSSPVYAAG